MQTIPKTMTIAVLLTLQLLVGVCLAQDRQNKAPANSPVQPASVPAAQQASPHYLEVPLIGAIGEKVTAQKVSDALDLAHHVGATHVIFMVDSAGGSMEEAGSIASAISETTDLQTIAFVKSADPAASVVAAACNTIVMHPEGKCGQLGEASHATAGHLSADARLAAQSRGHSPTLLDTFCDPTISLYVTKVGDQTQLSAVPLNATSVLVNPAHQPLLLSADSAVAHGFAKAVCKTMGDVRRALGFEQWTSCGDEGWNLMTNSPPRVITMVGPASSTRVPAPAKASRLNDNKRTALENKIRGLKTQIAEVSTNISTMEVNREHDLEQIGDSVSGRALYEQQWNPKHDKALANLNRLNSELRTKQAELQAMDEGQ